ncbi:hypothetical protein J3R30DRAFT_1679613 [Lentinula aciculospora]|uniref:Uncharacterized protein n=1 Tax=Lentinula aciculospora TaxID=153920 RepID=A0A9W9DGC8_9AGAR|nr:hypothetical protein J3R30DRAFT_1679613 [Lentinula aciculospora]
MSIAVSRVLARQAVSVDGSVIDLPAETPGLQVTTSSDAISVDGPVTMLPLESPGLQSVSVTSDLLTLSTFGIGLPTVTASSNDTSSSTRGGAIAGGVVAAVVVAVIAAAFLLRHRNKRSPRHWRNRNRGVAMGPFYNRSRWQNLDSKFDADNSAIQAGTSNVVLNDYKSPITSPVTAKFSTPPITYPPMLMVYKTGN